MVYILYICKDVSTISHQAILICEGVYIVISFQSYEISIYIKKTRRFWDSVNGDYELQSHSK